MGAIEVAGVGAAFLLINKGILASMMADHLEWRCGCPADWPDNIKPFHFEMFRPEQNGLEFISEDYVFCNRVRDYGGKVFVDPSIALVMSENSTIALNQRCLAGNLTMEIASEVRTLLLKIAKEIADEENATVGHLHLIIANGKLTDFIRQEFDKAVADLREAKQDVEEPADISPIDGNLQGAEDGEAKDADPEAAENGPSVEVADAEEPRRR